MSSQVTLNSGVTLNSLTFSMESHWLVSIAVILQGVSFLNQSLKVSAPYSTPPPNFLNAPMTFNLLFSLKQKFSKGKFEALRGSFDQTLISPNMSRDMQKPVWFSILLRKNIDICSLSPHLMVSNCRNSK